VESFSQKRKTTAACDFRIQHLLLEEQELNGQYTLWRHKCKLLLRP